jgi:hypothetical protein
MSSNKQNSAKRRNTNSTPSEENIKIPDVDSKTYEQMNPKIFTAKEPSKPDKLPDYIDDSQLSQESIKRIISEIQNTPQNKEKRLEYFRMKYADFAESYPILFDMACRDEFDYEKFNYMMRIRGQIEKKERTIEHASVEVGQKFYDMYMKK